MKRRVMWWPAIALVPLTLALFVGEQRLALSPTGHQTAQVAIVLFVFGLITMWLKTQDSGVQQEDIERYRMTFSASDRRPSAIADEDERLPALDAIHEYPSVMSEAKSHEPVEGRPETVFHHSLN